MDTKGEYFDDIINYLNANISDQEKLIFENELKENVELKTQFDLLKSMKNAQELDEWLKTPAIPELDNSKKALLQEFDELLLSKTKTDISDLQKSDYRERGKKQQVQSLLIKNKWFLAASIVAVTVLSVLLYKATSNNLDDLLLAYSNEIYSAPFITRDSENDNDWVRLYQNENYEEALAILIRLEDDEPIKIYYEGMCYFYLQKYNTAIKMYSNDKLNNSIFYQQSLWFQSLAYLKMNQTIKAKQKLDIIIINQYYKYNEASKILDLLD